MKASVPPSGDKNSAVHCFLRESYTNLSLHALRIKRAGTIPTAKNADDKGFEGAQKHYRSI